MSELNHTESQDRSNYATCIGLFLLPCKAMILRLVGKGCEEQQMAKRSERTLLKWYFEKNRKIKNGPCLAL